MTLRNQVLLHHSQKPSTQCGPISKDETQANGLRDFWATMARVQSQLDLRVHSKPVACGEGPADSAELSLEITLGARGLFSASPGAPTSSKANRIHGFMGEDSRGKGSQGADSLGEETWGSIQGGLTREGSQGCIGGGFTGGWRDGSPTEVAAT